MGSTFDSQFLTDALPGLLSEFGKAASVSRNAVTVTMTVIESMQEVKTHSRASGSRGGTESMVSRNWVTFLVKTASYDFGAGAVEPTPMDTFNVDSRRYQPRTPEGKEQCWEYKDSTSQIIKIYVEEV